MGLELVVDPEVLRLAHNSGGSSFHLSDFTEVVFKSVAYGLSGPASEFLFLVMSRSGSQLLFPGWLPERFNLFDQASLMGNNDKLYGVKQQYGSKASVSREG